MSRDLLYYFADGSQQRGPFTLAQLREHPLNPDTLVWRDGLASWTALANVPELWAAFAERVVDRPVEQPSQLNALPTADVAPMLNYSTPPINQGASGLALTALLLGILSFPAYCMPLIGWFIAPPAGIAAIVCGTIARSNARKHGAGGEGMALAGLILGIVNIVLIVVGIATIIIAIMFSQPPGNVPAAPSPAAPSSLPAGN